MTLSNERGSALIITLMLMLILTAIGIYAISISTTEMSIALQSKTGTATLNSAESGSNYAIDQIPVLKTGYTDNLADKSSYSVTSSYTGTMTFKPGYGSIFGFPHIEVASQGRAPDPFVATRTVQVVVIYGPVPVGTMY